MKRKRLVAIGLGILIILTIGVNLLFHEETPDSGNPYRDQLTAIARGVRSATGGKCRVLFRQGAGANPRTGHWYAPIQRPFTRYLFRWRGKGYIQLGRKTIKCITVYPVSTSSRVSLQGFGDCRLLGVLEPRTSFRMSGLSKDAGSGNAGAYLLVLPQAAGSEKRFVVLSVEPDVKGRYRFTEAAHGPLEELEAEKNTGKRVVVEFPDKTAVSNANPGWRATVKFAFREERFRLQIDMDIEFR